MSSWTNYKVRIFELYVAEDLRDSAVQWSEHSEQRNAITMIVWCYVRDIWNCQNIIISSVFKAEYNYAV